MAMTNQRWASSLEEDTPPLQPMDKGDRSLSHRACIECWRKKAKCDKKRPECSLCLRIGATCIYPTRRASYRKRAVINPDQVSAIPLQSTASMQEGFAPLSTDQPMWNGSIPFENSFIDPNYNSIMFPSHFPSFHPLTNVFSTVDTAFLDPSYNEICATLGMEFLDAAPQPSSDQSNQIAKSNQVDVGPDLPEAGSASPVSYLTPWIAMSRGSQKSSYTINVTPATAVDLVDTFFETIHSFLPLLHRDNFKKKHEQYFYSNGGDQLCNLSLESAFLLCGMFSLSARFSSASDLLDIQPIHRGERFARQAVQLYELSSKQLEDNLPSLQYLQATILLTFFTLQAGPSFEAWMRSSLCIRLAYELELHIGDADIICGETDITLLSRDEIILREERRRAWWVIWDLDTFAGFMTLRPCVVGSPQMRVLLPVSDEAWLAGEARPTTYLEPECSVPWRKLCDSPNQIPWVWFLAFTILIRQVTDVLLMPATSDNVLEELEAKFTCYTLATPEDFRLDYSSVRLNVQQARGMNWIIHAHVIMQGLQALILVRRKHVTVASTSWFHGRGFEADSSTPPKHAIRSQNAQIFDHLRHKVAGLMRFWPIESFPQCSPLICSCLIGPAISYPNEGEKKADDLNELDRQTIVLALKRLACHWMIAKVLLEELSHMEVNGFNPSPDRAGSEQAVKRHWRSMKIW